jgi:hypothetical protein
MEMGRNSDMFLDSGCYFIRVVLSDFGLIYLLSYIQEHAEVSI